MKKITAGIKKAVSTLGKTIVGVAFRLRCMVGLALGSLGYLLMHGPKRTLERLRERREERSGTGVQGLPAVNIRPPDREGSGGKRLFSIILPLENAAVDALADTLDYVRSQTYAAWELCIASGGTDFKTTDHIRRLMPDDPRIRLAGPQEKAGTARAVAEACRLSSGDYVILMQPGDLLDPCALDEMEKTIRRGQPADIVYTDWAEFANDKPDAVKYHPLPDFSPDNLRSENYVGHMAVYSRGILERAGFIREGYEGAEAHELLLRASESANRIVHIRKPLYWSRSNNENGGAESSSAAVESGRRAVSDHLDRIGCPGVVSPVQDLNAYRILYALKPAKVSIIIPNKDHIRELRRCVLSILKKTTYGDYEIIIAENNSTDPETFAYYELIAKDPRVRVFETGIRDFNYSAVNNHAARQAKGEYLLLLNNDTEVINPGWIGEMLMFAQRRDAGAVGALLLYRNRTVQHCGLVVGYGGNIAGNAWYGKPFAENVGPRVLRLPRNYSAVTAACLMVKKSDYFAVGGLDEADFAVGLNDVDFCLKLLEAGLVNVWTPHARLYHFESASRGSDIKGERKERFDAECKRLKEKWPRYFDEGDPFGQ